MHRIARIIPLLLLAACARMPDKIEPLKLSGTAYSGLTCEQLAAERKTASDALAVLEPQQKQTAMNDAVGVFLVGVPLSSLAGDDAEAAIAQRKGEIVAIDAARQRNNCP